MTAPSGVAASARDARPESFPHAAPAALANQQVRANIRHATTTIRRKRAGVVAEVDIATLPLAFLSSLSALIVLPAQPRAVWVVRGSGSDRLGDDEERILESHPDYVGAACFENVL